MWLWGERKKRIEAAEAAARKQERLALFIEHLRDEAEPVGAWARERYERNHLTELFHRGRSQ